ncbi:hypoxanthine phosphoribosyltransferase [Cytophagaceae bacterium ABcell3]|nr:hypoxanthine phosphoribosyltransferase [Cytophagaceae bacterium ABcell3]
MKVKDREFEVFIDRENIAKRVKELGNVISKEYEGLEPIFVVVLNGGFMFASDLLKEVSIPCHVSFVKVSSWHGIESSGSVKKLLGLQEDIKGKHIIVVDDIVDTGLTMKEIIEDLRKEEPASIEIASFIIKPEALSHPIETKYVGFTIPEHFILGYGLDYEGLGRNLKDIYRLKS